MANMLLNPHRPELTNPPKSIGYDGGLAAVILGRARLRDHFGMIPTYLHDWKRDHAVRRLLFFGFFFIFKEI